LKVVNPAGPRRPGGSFQDDPMKARQELKINARGLSAPGPRLMVEAALAEGPPSRFIRVVVSTLEAVDDLKAYFAERDAIVKVDNVGEEFHVMVELKE
jgi:TusA-related sulfurtransferase